MLVHSPKKRKKEKKKKKKENDVIRLVLMRMPKVNDYNGSNECTVVLGWPFFKAVIRARSESVRRQSQLLEVIPKKAVDCQEDKLQHTLIS
jgi:hypothetical protein